MEALKLLGGDGSQAHCFQRQGQCCLWAFGRRVVSTFRKLPVRENTASPHQSRRRVTETRSRRNRWCCSLPVWVNSDSDGWGVGGCGLLETGSSRPLPDPPQQDMVLGAHTKNKCVVLLFSPGFTIGLSGGRWARSVTCERFGLQCWKTHRCGVFVQSDSELGDFSLLHHALCNGSDSDQDEWVVWQWRRL